MIQKRSFKNKENKVFKYKEKNSSLCAQCALWGILGALEYISCDGFTGTIINQKKSCYQAMGERTKTKNKNSYLLSALVLNTSEIPPYSRLNVLLPSSFGSEAWFWRSQRGTSAAQSSAVLAPAPPAFSKVSAREGEFQADTRTSQLPGRPHLANRLAIPGPPLRHVCK